MQAVLFLGIGESSRSFFPISRNHTKGMKKYLGCNNLFFLQKPELISLNKIEARCSRNSSDSCKDASYNRLDHENLLFELFLIIFMVFRSYKRFSRSLLRNDNVKIT